MLISENLQQKMGLRYARLIQGHIGTAREGVNMHKNGMMEPFKIKNPKISKVN